MKVKSLIILGSSRKNSNTEKLVTKIFSTIDIELLDLLDFEINHYNYNGAYPETDEFIKVAEQLLKFDTVVFATPVYWYSMSGILKVFFDRLTDLVTVQKNLGRQLKGKRIFLVVAGAEKKLQDGFETPFRLTSEYFEMEFVVSYYCDTNYLHLPLTDTSSFLSRIKI